MHREGVSNLEPLNPEIERTCRRNRKKKKKKVTIADKDNNNASHNGNIGADQNRALQEFVVPHLEGLNASIVHPQITANNFELKPVMF